MTCFDRSANEDLYLNNLQLGIYAPHTDIAPDFGGALKDQMYIAEPFATQLFGPATEFECPGCKIIGPIDDQTSHQSTCTSYTRWLIEQDEYAG